MSAHKLRVLIADDHPLFRKGLSAVLSSEPDMEVVGEAAGGQETLAKTADLQPDLVLMDLQMPNGGGLATTREIRRMHPDVHVLVVTLSDEDDSVFAALRAGSHGYVLKDADETEMLRAVRAVGAGEAIFSPAIATRVLLYFSSRTAIHSSAFPSLTEREQEVLALVAVGQTNSRIAQQLGLSPKTVGNHVSNIFSKLQVADRAEAIIRAREAGLR